MNKEEINSISSTKSSRRKLVYYITIFLTYFEIYATYFKYSRFNKNWCHITLKAIQFLQNSQPACFIRYISTHINKVYRSKDIDALSENELKLR